MAQNPFCSCYQLSRIWKHSVLVYSGSPRGFQEPLLMNSIMTSLLTAPFPCQSAESGSCWPLSLRESAFSRLHLLLFPLSLLSSWFSLILRSLKYIFKCLHFGAQTSFFLLLFPHSHSHKHCLCQWVPRFIFLTRNFSLNSISKLHIQHLHWIRLSSKLVLLGIILFSWQLSSFYLNQNSQCQPEPVFPSSTTQPSK